MKYLLRFPDNPALEYPNTFDELQSGYSIGTMAPTCQVRAEQSTDWIGLREFIASGARIPTTPSDATTAGQAPTGSPAARLMIRYRDAYVVGRTIVTVGDVVKGVGIVLAIGMTLAAWVNFKMGPAGILIGVVVGVPLYVLGILVSAQGQILKATLDTAVSGSPFLSNDQKAEMMSLV